MMKLNGKRVLVVGLAKSGAAMARFLKKKGAVVTVTDRAEEKDLKELADEMESLGIKKELGSHSLETFTNQDLIVLSPGVPHTLPQIKTAEEYGVPVIGEIELASCFIKEPIVAITGTNGKTTTTTLVSLMLEAAGMKVFTGGNIGDPLTGYVDGEMASDVVVVEVSSFQLDTIKTFRPKVAVLLNITDDHLDRYPDFNAYARSKGRIFENQEREDIAIVNGDDAPSLAIGKVLQNRLFLFGAKGSGYSAVIGRKSITLNTPGNETQTIDLSSTRLIGSHNRENIAAAALAALSAGGTLSAVQHVVDTFPGLPHRIEYIDTVCGVDFYDDSKATNMDAVLRALDAFDRKLVLILGGRNKGGDYLQLKEAVLKSARSVLAIGESANEVKTVLGPFIKVTEMPSLEDAVKKGLEEAKPGECVLLSPACSSFDMFRNYEHRSQVFVDAVRRLKQENA
jgi:UDP-N-acetylmuramoylalanine--D-glutamate ligase